MRSEHYAHDKAGSRTEADPHRVAGQGEDNGPGSCAEHQSETDGDCRSISGIVVLVACSRAYRSTYTTR